MKGPRHLESKIDSQFERLSFFTDGVFAICITLLVIEIKVPEVKNFTDSALLEKLSDYSFKFLGFAISFGIIGHYWTVHHRIFGYVKKYDSSLIWINFCFLFSVVILPFSSGLLAEYSNHPDMALPYLFYVLNMCFTAIVNCWLWLYVSNPKREMLTHKISPVRIRLGIYRSLIVPAVFVLSFFISLLAPLVGRLIPVLIPVILHFGMKGIEKRADIGEVNPEEDPEHIVLGAELEKQ